MAPSLNSHRGSPVVVKLENPNNWSMVELTSPDDESDVARAKNAKQITWVLLLKAHRAAGCLSSLAPASFSLVSAVRRRLLSGRTDESPAFTTRFYTFIKLFLFLSVLLLGFEVAAHYKALHFSLGFHFHFLYSNWVQIRVAYIAPVLQFLADSCVVLFLIQSADRLILCLGCFWIRFKGIKPKPIGEELQDVEK